MVIALAGQRALALAPSRRLSHALMLAAGNKSDMEAKRKVQTEEAQQYAQENEIIFMETSAKTATNVRNLFVEIGKSPPCPAPLAGTGADLLGV